MEMNRIIRADNLDTMDEIMQSGTQFDLILTDPPYNVGKDFGNDTDKQDPLQFYNFLKPRVERVECLLSPKGSFITFCSQRHIYDVMDVVATFTLLKYQRMM